MAFQEVSAPRKYFKLNQCSPEDVLVEGAWYKGTIQSKFGINHLFRHEDSSETVLPSSGHLNYLLKDKVREGDFVRVVYNGKERLTKGTFAGTESHQFRVYIDPSKRGEVGGFQEVAESTEGEGF